MVRRFPDPGFYTVTIRENGVSTPVELTDEGQVVALAEPMWDEAVAATWLEGYRVGREEKTPDPPSSTNEGLEHGS